MVRLIIIDRNILYRECMIAMLKSAGGLSITGSFSGIGKLSGIREQKNNDLVILKVDDDIYSAVKSISKARRLFPKIPILVYGGNSSEKFKIQITNQGAQSYIDIFHTLSEFIKAVKKTSSLKINKSSFAKKHTDNNQHGIQTPGEKLTRLSNRELLVLKMIAAGKSVRDISRELTLKISTVHTFRTRLMNKLKLKNNVEIALFAISNKIVNSV